VWTQTGIRPPELEIEPLPVELQYLREVFWDLWSSDGWSWGEFKAYQDLMGMDFNLAEITTLRAAHGRCSKFVRDKIKAKNTPKSKKSPGRK